VLIVFVEIPHALRPAAKRASDERPIFIADERPQLGDQARALLTGLASQRRGGRGGTHLSLLLA
jgi:hypothetical protein